MTERIMDGQVGLFDLDTWSGRTSPEHSVPMVGKTSKQSLKRSSKSSSQKSPICVQLYRGGWTKSGCLYSALGEWSIAWRVHDAQFWGVPQRRKRIALVADFGGLSAPEILFERKGMSRDPEPSAEAREGTAEGAEGSTGEPSAFHLTQDPIVSKNHTPCISSGNPVNGQCSVGISFSIQGNTIDRDVKQNGGGISVEVAHTLNSVDRHAVTYGFDGSMGAKAGNIGYEEEMAMTTKSTGGGGKGQTSHPE